MTDNKKTPCLEVFETDLSVLVSCEGASKACPQQINFEKDLEASQEVLAALAAVNRRAINGQLKNAKNIFDAVNALGKIEYSVDASQAQTKLKSFVKIHQTCENCHKQVLKVLAKIPTIQELEDFLQHFQLKGFSEKFNPKEPQGKMDQMRQEYRKSRV